MIYENYLTQQLDHLQYVKTPNQKRKENRSTSQNSGQLHELSERVFGKTSDMRVEVTLN